MENTAKDTLVMIERELIKFASYDNVKSMLSKYMVGSYDQDTVEKLLVILSSEFRKVLERVEDNLPDDDVEAAAVVARRSSPKRGKPRKEVDVIIDDDEDE